MTPDDPLPKLRAELDQAIAGMAEFGRLMHGHFQTMTAAGFTDAQALALTRDYQLHMLTQFGGSDD